MNFYLDKLTVDHCFHSKSCASFEMLPCESPYHEVEDMEKEELFFKEEYVHSCVKYACRVWCTCNFSKNLAVVYEDKYNTAKNGESKFIEGCLEVVKSGIYSFQWIDDGEKYYGTRYIWDTSRIEVERLFRKIIISDIGDDTELDCAVYIVDKDTDNVFFLYDDRGIHVFSNDAAFIDKLRKLGI